MKVLITIGWMGVVVFSRFAMEADANGCGCGLLWVTVVPSFAGTDADY
jgi:hypothetical protein